MIDYNSSPNDLTLLKAWAFATLFDWPSARLTHLRTLVYYSKVRLRLFQSFILAPLPFLVELRPKTLNRKIQRKMRELSRKRFHRIFTFLVWFEFDCNRIKIHSNSTPSSFIPTIPNSKKRNLAKTVLFVCVQALISQQ